MKTVPSLCRALVACGITFVTFHVPAKAQSGTVNLTITTPVPPDCIAGASGCATQTGSNPNSYSLIVPTHAPTVLTVNVSNPSSAADTIVDATNVTLSFGVPKGVKLSLTVTSPPCTLSHTGGGDRQVTCTIDKIAVDTTTTLYFAVQSNQTGLVSLALDAATPDEFPLPDGNNTNVMLNLAFQ